MNDELRQRARESASERPDDEWGTRVTLEPGDEFSGRWRGQTSRSGDYGEQPVYLLWDDSGAEVFLYGGRVVLDRKIEQLGPGEGDSIVISRIEDDYSNGRTIHRYGVATAPNSDALPAGPPDVDW